MNIKLGSFKTSLMVGDIVIAGLSFIAMLATSFDSNWRAVAEIHIPPFLALYFIWFILIYVFNGYDRQFIRPTIATTPQFFGLLISWLVIGVVFFYFVPWFGITPKSNLLLAISFFGLGYILWRRFAYQLFIANIKQPLILVGNHPRLTQIENTVLDGNLPFFFVGRYENWTQVPKRIHAGTLILHSIPHDAHESVAIIKSSASCVELGAFIEYYYEYEPLDAIADGVINEISQGQYQSTFYDSARRIIDLLFAFAILTVTLPITIPIMILIKLTDKGPIFYTQVRTGLYNKPFTLLKFRSMRTDAEATGASWATKNDSRVTPLGKFLRKSHIDEIPQMINILKGDIGLVGPRPERPEFVEQLEAKLPLYNLRHIVRPGFTGWAQVKYNYARSFEDSARKLEFDLYYIKHRSLSLDLGIILKTGQILVTHD